MLLFHRCKGRCLLALFLVGWALPGHAQPRLTADQAVQLATSQPHVRDALEAGVDRARSDVLAARTWENPTLELEQEREDSAAGAPARETSVLLSQPLELGGRRGLRRDAAEQAEGQAGGCVCRVWRCPCGRRSTLSRHAAHRSTRRAAGRRAGRRRRGWRCRRW